ncbi:MAG TPA: hypothetical protein VE819_06955 [Steroidobacteraceae bacterium]|jgi:hypothetical protein|nr:hypothetical protein [Steroidobacteraceae bacterium]
MSKRNLPLPVLLSAFFGMSMYVVCGAETPAQPAEKPAAAKAAPTDAELIASAESAAPANVGKNATIMAMEAEGKMRTLRKGTNNFTCMPDNPATPGPDPMCMDPAAMEWVHAYVSHTKPTAGKIGFMYMLAGGTDASNTDPYAVKPTANNHWIQTGPHVMIVGADPSFYDLYPKSVDPDTSVPYVMWAGTPYQHLMAPIKAARHSAPKETAAK